ncbi:MAG: hypothetical protein LBS05_01130 [Tannerellaceae bacterium]|nr:hypothetical protein [Tannerellaceae bacterium]
MLIAQFGIFVDIDNVGFFFCFQFGLENGICLIAGNDLQRIRFCRFDNDFPDGFCHFRNILFEQFDGFAEIGHFRTFKREKFRQQEMQGIVVAHIATQDFFTVLYQHGNTAIFKQDIVFGVSFGKLLLDFFVEVVGFVFTFPVTPILPEAVFECAVGRNGFATRRFNTDFGNHYQLPLTGVIVQQVVKCVADGGFFFCAAEVFQFFYFGVVEVDGVN